MGRVTLASDTFNRADNADLGAAWTPQLNSFQIVGNRARAGTVGDNIESYALTLSPNQWVQTTLHLSGGAGDWEADPTLRFTDTSNYYQMRCHPIGGGTWTTRFTKNVAGTPTNIAENATVTWADGDVQRFEVQGTSLRAYRNDVLVLSATDSAITGAGIGPAYTIFVDTAVSQVELDDWSAGEFADEAIWDLDALTTPALEDLLAVVDDPGGTPATKKLTLSNFLAALALSNTVVQVKTVGSGTYTPTAGMKKVLAIAVGGGGAGGSGTNTDSAGGGGGGGGTVIRLLTAAQIGASKAYVVGAAGAATTLDAGTLMNAGAGGAGGDGSQAAGLGLHATGGTGGTAANGDLNIPGCAGGAGITYSTTHGMGGTGGNSVFGFGGQPGGSDVVGADGAAYGAGGAGGHAAGTPNRLGGAGSAGILYLFEFF